MLSAYSLQSHDVSMEIVTGDVIKNLSIQNVKIVDYEQVDNYVTYKMEVHVHDCSWHVSRRYREFYKLHEELVSLHGVAWELLPPKKVVRNLDPLHIMKRRLLLEKYLNQIVRMLPTIPQCLMEFLEVDRFDVSRICQQLAKEIYYTGDDILAKSSVFCITPLRVHCIHRRLQLPLSTSVGCESDIGHLYAFIQQVQRVKMQGGSDDSSFVGEHDLTCDLSIFRSLRHLEIVNCDMDLIEGIEAIQNNLEELSISGCLQLLKDFLISSECWAQGILLQVQGGEQQHSDVASQFKKWPRLKSVSFAANGLHSIDYSITLLPNLVKLDLSHNLLKEVQFLEELTSLVDLNLSYNEIRNVGEFAFRIPGVAKLNLAGNGLQNVTGLERLYALEELDLSNNNIDEVSDVLLLGKLPLLTCLLLKGNGLTNAANHRVRLLAQFGDRAEEVMLDGVLPTKREMSKVHEVLSAHDSYEVIDADIFVSPSSQRPTAAGTLSAVTSSIPTPGRQAKSPRIKKKDHLVTIHSPTKSGPEMRQQEKNEDSEFRRQVELLHDKGGDNWLTYLNEMHIDAGDQKEPRITSSREEGKAGSGERQDQQSKSRKEKAAKHVSLVEPDTTNERSGHAGDGSKRPASTHVISESEIDLELSTTLRAAVKEAIATHVNISEETFVILATDSSGTCEEHMLAFDMETRVLIRMVFCDARTVCSYMLDSMWNVSLVESDGQILLSFVARAVVGPKLTGNKADEPKPYTLRMLSAKDGGRLYAVLKSFDKSRRRKSAPGSFETAGVSASAPANPLDIPNEVLLAFFQDFVRKTPVTRKPIASKAKATAVPSNPNYANIDIGLSFLRHDSSEATSQDVVLTLWAGCLPYLFPDEEIPVCVVMTNLNVFLFRVFLSDSDAAGGDMPTSVAGLQDVLHCFYSFPLRSLKAVVVILFDQGFRVEVKGEGPRGTFVFLTRDASKTSEFLDALGSILGLNTDRESPYPGARDIEGAHHRLPVISYPDEHKIGALKLQLTSQQMKPLGECENVISYCIVYERRDDTGDCGRDRYESVSRSRLRSLILTTERLFLCDEDYVHWPLPSYVRSAPVTPQWVVVSVESVRDIIGTTLWEDAKGRAAMTGCYGVLLTFESALHSGSASQGGVRLGNGWTLMFQSIDEREQFVRSLACLWKNQFDQDLRITYAKSELAGLKSTGSGTFVRGHQKRLSGNMAVPSDTPVESPDMLLGVDKVRLNEIFRVKIAVSDEDADAGVQYIAVTECKPYTHPDREVSTALLLGKSHIYLVAAAVDERFLRADRHFRDTGAANALHFLTIKIADLKQVIMGLFDQTFRLETDLPESTFVFVTRDFDRTSEFVQRLSQAILALPPTEPREAARESAPRTRTAGEIFFMYKKEEESPEGYYPKTEFIHPNSDTKFVYPSDEMLEKLKLSILSYIRVMDLFEQSEDFGVLVYALVFQLVDGTALPRTLVISERFACLICEDHVDYPLPLFVRELPDRPQYEVIGVRLVSSLVRIEFVEFSSGEFSLVFNRQAVDPQSYDERFRTDNVEGDVCLVTDVNTCPERVQECDLVSWEMQAQSYVDREKIFNILSKMWTYSRAGGTLPVLRRKENK